MAKKIIAPILALCAVAIAVFALWQTGILKLPKHQKQNPLQKIEKTCTISEGDREVTLGMSTQEIEDIFGTPFDTIVSEYGFIWNIYHNNFKNYIQIGIDNNTVVAMYSNSPDLSFKGLTVGSSKEEAHAILKEPLDGIVKDDTRYLSNGSDKNANFEIFEADGAYITLFYDSLANNSITSVNIIDYDVEQSFKRLYAEPSQELKESFEKQSFYITNAVRAREGLTPYLPHQQLDEIAYAHSSDMVENDFFNHTNLNGDSVLERGLNHKIDFSAIGENLAMGAQNSLYMHELLMNSEGHRKNILADFTHLGTGVAFKDDGSPYLTQNFLK